MKPIQKKMGMSYNAKKNCKNLNNFFPKEEEIKDILETSNRYNYLTKKSEEDILTPEEMAEYERIVKNENVSS